jgi:hypothetical protein
MCNRPKRQDTAIVMAMARDAIEAVISASDMAFREVGNLIDERRLDDAQNVIIAIRAKLQGIAASQPK